MKPQQPPRYVPDRPLPPYTYVPGRSPHPVSDPAGHQFGKAPEAPDTLDVEQWHSNSTYLYGIDLFNHGYYWEAHEAWESLWRHCGCKGTTADFLKALIHLAAAGVKHLVGIPAGLKSHTRRASELFRNVAGVLGTETDCFLGLRLKDLRELAEEMYRDGWPEVPVHLQPTLP
jgi:predicted metal-dependent hydrolase